MLGQYYCKYPEELACLKCADFIMNNDLLSDFKSTCKTFTFQSSSGNGEQK